MGWYVGRMIVVVTNRLGKKLSCIVDFKKSKKDLAGVLLVHGFKGFAKERHLQTISDSLVGAGFLTLRPDLTRNPGKSYLKFSQMTYAQELLDLEDVFEYLLKRPEVDPKRVGIAGHSLGGLLAAELAAKRKEVKSLVALSAVYDFGGVAKRVFRRPLSRVKKDLGEKGWTYVWSSTLKKNLIIKKEFYEDAIDRSAADFAKNVVCPTLVISSGRDESVNQSHADRYMKTLGSKIKQMEIIEGADHIYSGQALSKITKLVTDWFLKTLK